jgi:hypothetical protein
MWIFNVDFAHGLLGCEVAYQRFAETYGLPFQTRNEVALSNFGFSAGEHDNASIKKDIKHKLL